MGPTLGQVLIDTDVTGKKAAFRSLARVAGNVERREGSDGGMWPSYLWMPTTWARIKRYYCETNKVS